MIAEAGLGRARYFARGFALVCLPACWAMGCGAGAAGAPDAVAIRDAHDTGSKVAAATDAERAVLDGLDAVPANEPRRVGTTTVTAGVGYDAASGRFCRSVTFDAQASQKPVTRLACREDRKWFFVPDVMAASAGP